ncbi:glycosyltransferase [Brassicibacter mesophilus]|uniref:glycosyltransferase n=1 Tax=Brassicibacter mesophilus TaxID=745119 RepID=UPI003D1D3FDA
MNKNYKTKKATYYNSSQQVIKIKNPVNKTIPKIKKIKEIKKKTIQPYVSIITVTNRKSHMNRVFNNYKWQNYKNKKFIIVINNNSINIDEWIIESKHYKNVKIFQLDENLCFSECKIFAFKKCSYDFICHFDDDDFYAPNFIKNGMNYFNYKDADIIGKKTAFVYFEKSKLLALRFPYQENCYVDFVLDSSMIIKRRLLSKVEFPIMKTGADFEFQKKCIKSGFKIYSTDKYNYVFHRHDSTDKHSWKITEEKLLKECIQIKSNINDYTEFVMK